MNEEIRIIKINKEYKTPMAPVYDKPGPRPRKQNYGGGVISRWERSKRRRMTK